MLDITVLAPENSGIAAVAGIKAELMAALDKAGSGSTILLDISKTKRADSSLAQLIIAFERDAAAKGCKSVIRESESRHSLLTMFCCDSIEGSNAEVRHER
ncbi:MAG: hypothetical protein A2Y38_11805 [Spirochaetes bacterium GWB1_59_5]|nr:MAG: hypothetical protein A2Y38_11805 [Spirochaetes bacterium GWB1_59_5]